MKTTRNSLEDTYKIKVGVLGLGAGQMDEVRILNKVVRMTNMALSSGLTRDTSR